MMTIPSRFANVFIIALLSIVLCGQVSALDIDVSGDFQYDNDVLLVSFELLNDAEVTLFTSSWLSGDSGLGFDPVMALWSAGGDYMTGWDDAGMAGSDTSNGVLYDYGEWDVYAQVYLIAGVYTVSLTQYDNYAVGANLADGFIWDDEPAFTAVVGSQPYFNGSYSPMDGRTGHYDLHVLNVDRRVDAVVPEPASFALLGMGVACLGVLRGRRHRE